MAGRWIVLAGLLGALLAPAGAQAGTYDVVSCGAPGAGGRNNSLTAFAESYDPQYAPQLGAWYEHDATCADGLVARSSTTTATTPTAAWLTGAGWRFTAPAGTEIVGFASWRFAEARDQAPDDPGTPVDDGDHWRVDVIDGTGQVVGGALGGETCAHGGGVDACTVGAPGGVRADHRLITNQLSWRLVCGGEIVGGCPTNYGGYSLATMVVYGTQITLRDDSAPTASLRGPLATPGWHRPGDGLTYSASDNSGIRTATLTAGAVGGGDPRAVRLHPSGAVRERRGAAAAGGRDAARRPLSGPPDRRRRGGEPDRGRRRRGRRRQRALGRPAPAARADDRGRRARHRVRVRGRADPRPQQHTRGVPAAADAAAARDAARSARPRQAREGGRAGRGPRQGGQRGARRPRPVPDHERHVAAAAGAGPARWARAGQVRARGDDPRSARALRAAAGGGRAGDAWSPASGDAARCRASRRPGQWRQTGGSSSASARARRGRPTSATREEQGSSPRRGGCSCWCRPPPRSRRHDCDSAAPGRCGSAAASAARRGPGWSSCCRGRSAAAGGRSPTPAPARADAGRRRTASAAGLGATRCARGSGARRICPTRRATPSG